MTSAAPMTSTELEPRPRIMVHVVAYNAVSTLAKTLDRIPRSTRELLTEICVFDDHSRDDTYLIGEGYRAVRGYDNLRVFRNPKNLGYGGNQKLGYRYAIDRGFDFVVLLHGDGQYAPEVMEDLLAPLLAGEADAVFGSRMMVPGAARRGGMPRYKHLGNRVLSRFQNEVLGMNLTEFHSGYRAYRVQALSRIPFEANSNDFHFDTQIIIQLMSAGFRIKEVPIPTYYGDEICHVNGMKYARDVVRSVLDYRRHRAGLVSLPEYAHVLVPRYEEKESPFSSHQRIIQAVSPGTRVLDVGCASGYLAAQLKKKGCTVVGVDGAYDEAAARILDEHHVADLEEPWEPREKGFDFILFADVIEHLRSLAILDRAKGWLAPGGRIIASTGNVALWYIRLQLARGRFDYTPRGILDETHVKLYTRRTFRDLFRRHGYDVVREDFSPIPIERLFAEARGRGLLKEAIQVLEHAGYFMARRFPELMAYQILLEAEPGLTLAKPVVDVDPEHRGSDAPRL